MERCNHLLAPLVDHRLGWLQRASTAAVDPVLPPRAVFLATRRDAMGAHVMQIRRFLKDQGLRETVTGAVHKQVTARRPREWSEPGSTGWSTRASTPGRDPSLRFDRANSHHDAGEVNGLRRRPIALGRCSHPEGTDPRDPAKGVLNVHPGLLPDARGVDVIEWPLLRSIPTGVTVHFVDPGIDTSAIQIRSHVKRQPGESISELRDRIGRESANALREPIELIAAWDASPVLQDANQGRTSRARSRDQRRPLERLLGEAQR